MAGALLLSALLGLAAPQGGGRDDVNFFSVPVTRNAAEIAARAEEHIAAERWGEALTELSRLLVDHPGDLLPDGWDADERPPSLYRVHPGAAQWAFRRLQSLPPVARELYRERTRAEAEPALAEAVRRGDRRALARVAQSWPVTPAAERAWWVLGDLELELGQVDEAVRCWRRALELLELQGREAPPGAEARFARADTLLHRDPEFSGATTAAGSLPGATPAGLHLPGPGQGHGPVPQRDADEPWSYRLPDNPYASDYAQQPLLDTYCLVPVLAGDRVLVNTSLQVCAIDAYTGREVWRTPEPPGWTQARRRDFFRAVDRTNGLVSCAAGGGVVVAPLQIPHENLRNSNFQGITIMVTIPERRLFAFDMETGEELWNHMPPPLWDGLSGPFEERTQVCGPPTIVGSRVLVPAYRLQGRIDFHVACYELSTGELLWNTGLISGQRELNMFGRHEEEFSAPPVRVEGDRVLALTQLGTVAALDLFTGRILWESLYEQIPLPKNRSWRTQARIQVWRNAPPVVADGAVIVTPLDSDNLAAFDLETGSQMWSRSYDRLRSARRGPFEEPNVLIGADSETVYLGGGSLVAVRKPGGLGRAGGEFQVDVLDPLREVRSNAPLTSPPRPVLGREEVLVPTDSARISIDRDGPLRRSAPVPWDGRQVGNPLLGSGVLYTLNSRFLHGFYDWHILLRRAEERLAASPGDEDAVVEYADLLGRKGGSLFADGRRSEALSIYTQARSVLEPAHARAGHTTTGALADSLHLVLRGEAEVRAAEADPERALRLLERALPLAPDEAARRDTLLEEEELVREERERWLAVLHELESLSSELLVPDDRLDASGDGPWAGQGPLERPPVPLGLWVLVRRSAASVRDGRPGEAFEDLHAVLARYPDTPIDRDRTAADLANARIEELLAGPARSAYEPFERRARALLDAALAEHDRSALERLTELYPQAAATDDARRSLLEWAFEAGDTAEVARRVFPAMSGERRPTAADAGLLWRLARTLAAEGNQAFARGVARRLADEPAAAELRGELAAWTEAHPEPARPEPLSERATFDESLRRADWISGKWEVLGRTSLERADGFEDVVVLASGKKIMAFSSRSPATVLWVFHTNEKLTPAFSRAGVHLADGRLVVAGENEVLAIDVETGAPLWDHRQAEPLEYLTASDGVALLMDAGSSTHLRALDCASGHPLWELELPRKRTFIAPIHGDGYAVFLPQLFNDVGPAQVVDLFRGIVVGEIDTGPSSSTPDRAWIEHGQLVLPSYQSSRPGEDVVALDLLTGRRTWGVELRESEHLHSIARTADSAFLVVRPSDPGAGSAAGSLLELDTRLGATRRVMELPVALEPIGWRAHETVTLDGPHLFLHDNTPGAPNTAVVAVHLPYGKRWVHRLDVSQEELHNRGMPRPAVSRSSVALAYATRGLQPGPTGMHLTFVDRSSGLALDNRKLSTELGQSANLEIVPLGRGLLLVGSATHGPSRIEIWENR